MKKRTPFIIFALLISTIISADIPGLSLIKTSEKLFVGVIENRQKQLEKAEEERAQLVKTKQESETELRSLVDETKAQIDQITQQLKDKPNDAFLKQKQIFLNELYQTLRESARDRERVIVLIDDFIRLLKEFIGDSDFTNFKKQYRLGERLFYSFDDLQRLYNFILDQEKKVALWVDEEKHASTELESRKQAEAATRQAYKQKKELIEAGKNTEWETFDVQQRNELIELEERIYHYRISLDTLRVKEIEYKIEYLSLQLSMGKSHLTIFKEYLKTNKPAVRVTEADIIHAHEEIDKRVHEYQEAKEQYRSEIDVLSVIEEQSQKELEGAAKKYGITLGHEITDWFKEGIATVSSYLAYCEVATLQTEFFMQQRKKEFLEAQIELLEEKIRDEKLQLQVKESYHKKFNTEEEIALELKKYDGPKAESQAALSRAKERVNLVADQINNQKKIIDNILALQKDIEKQQETTFKSHESEYKSCINLIKRAEELQKDQIDTLSKLASIYSGISLVATSKLRLIAFIIGELESRTIWYRPEYAITWEGIKNIIPDIVNFLTLVRNYFTRGTILITAYRLLDFAKEPMNILVLLFKLLIIFIALFVLYRLFPHLINVLKAMSDRGITRTLGLLLAGIAGFIYTYFFHIAIWAVLFSLLLLQDNVDTYIYILFYLVSIPYLIFIVNRFISYLAQFNEEYDYALIAADFQRRFWFVLSALMYSTIIIFFFREAFMLAHYYRSELPTILLAVNFIIFQIGLILLLDKEQILNFIPGRGEVGQWVREQVDRFYYLILLMIITVIVMSNPYVGFGRLVLYALFGFLYTIVLLIFLYYMHGLFKRIASRLFFATVDDVARERFNNAKTWFGITIIISFLSLSFLGLVIGAKIWGWPITLEKVTAIFHRPIIGGETESPITFVTFFTILLFVLVGFIAAYALNKFVLDRIFDLLLVDPGVQHTVSSLTQYLVIITAVFLGFQSAHLGALINVVVGALILGLGWVLKEPIGDFVAYFIILVQRPIKIGDFIKIDGEITGVVRKITARSVILRRKNSTTLVVPNLFLINKTIVNWNYTRNFIAFDDIFVGVDYDEDPEKVRKVLYEVLENHSNILKNPKPWVRLDHFGDFGYEFMVRGFISSVYTLEKWEIASNIRISIVKAFEERGIKMALPTRLLVTKKEQAEHSLAKKSSPPILDEKD